MSTAGGILAEIYVMRKLYKEKMESMEDHKAAKEKDVHNNKEKKRSHGSFGFGKKVHPREFPSSISAEDH